MLARNPWSCGVTLENVVVDPVVVDFFVAAYLALSVMASAKAGRSADDQLRYGIGRYHGAFDKMVAAQKAVSPADGGASVVAFLPVKLQMESSSDSERQGRGRVCRRSIGLPDTRLRSLPVGLTTRPKKITGVGIALPVATVATLRAGSAGAAADGLGTALK